MVSSVIFAAFAFQLVYHTVRISPMVDEAQQELGRLGHEDNVEKILPAK